MNGYHDDYLYFCDFCKGTILDQLANSVIMYSASYRPHMGSCYASSDVHVGPSITRVATHMRLLDNRYPRYKLTNDSRRALIKKIKSL